MLGIREKVFSNFSEKEKSEVVQGIEKDLRELSTKYNELGIENQDTRVLSLII